MTVGAANKDIKIKRKILHTVMVMIFLDFFDNLLNFTFTTSEAIIKHGIYELPHELPNNLSLSILGN